MKNICDITATYLEKFFLDLIEANDYSESFSGNLIGYVNQALAYAKRSAYLTGNPMDCVDRQLLLAQCTPADVKPDSERILTDEEIFALKDAIAEHQSRNPRCLPDYAIELALLTGMRVGEIAALKWSCIDDMYIHVDFSEHRLDYKGRTCELVIYEPKNRKHRLIPITSDIRVLINRIKNMGLYDKEGFVFVNENGKRYAATAIGCATTKRCKSAGIDHGSIHRIRRTVSSKLNQFLPQKDVAEILGHSEKVNEMHYNFSTADVKGKKAALSGMSAGMKRTKTA